MTAQREARRADGARRRKPGALVILRAGDLPTAFPDLAPDTEILCLNAVRQGKGFLNHYLVPLSAPLGAQDDLPLIYVDYNLSLVDASDRWTLDLVPAEDDTPRTGRVLENRNGRFLKTVEPYKDAFSLAYVDIASGQVRRRQDRGVTAVLDWHIVPRTDPPAEAPAATTAPAPPPPSPSILTGLDIRRLEDADVDAVAALCAACGLGHGGDLAMRLRPVVDSPLMIGRIIDSPDGLLAAAWAVQDGLDAWVSRIVVTPSARRQGLGRLLMDTLAKEAHRLDLRSLRGTVSLADGSFAAACGFVSTPAQTVERLLGRS